MYVYAAAPSDHGPTKIGKAADPKERLRYLQAGHPALLTIHHVEPIGIAAAAVERAAHRALATKKTTGGRDWFDVTAEEARIVIRSAAAAAHALIDNRASLRESEFQIQNRWFAERERYRIDCEEREEYDSEELDDCPPPGVLPLFAGTVRPPLQSRFSFNSYLLTWDEGMWLRWAFERMGQRMPSGRRLKAYLEADDFLEGRGAVYRREVASRWIEWSAGRDLRSDEARALAAVWDKFVPLHNVIERKGPQWATHGVDDHVDDVHLFALSGDERRGDRSCAVFRHEGFRAVLVPQRHIDLHHIEFSMIMEVRPLGDIPVSGFVAPVMPYDIWERPFLPWLRAASQQRDVALSLFLNNPAKRFPAPRAYDGPQPATRVWVQLPRIDEDGTF